MKIAIYSRKSKFTGKGDSIGNQIDRCKDYINFIFMGTTTTLITAIVALITKLWVMFSLKKLSKY